TKRRRLEAAGASQDSPHDGRSKHRKSPSEDIDESWEWDRERMDRKEKKRDHSTDDFFDDNKRRKSEDHHAAARKQNGEPNGSSKSHGERDYKEKSKAGHSSRREMYIDADDTQKVVKVKEKRDKSYPFILMSPD
ncbi:hypothetical protein PoB_003566300, partial [Plakobranchus ocellatus]